MLYENAEEKARVPRKRKKQNLLLVNLQFRIKYSNNKSTRGCFLLISVQQLILPAAPPYVQKIASDRNKKRHGIKKLTASDRKSGISIFIFVVAGV